jgi:hypothetical protein
MDALAGVLNPGTKLWNTGVGATVMREAVSLVGGYGITEDCPGFLCHKWMDAQLEATYEGPEAVQRRHLSLTMTNPVFLEVMRQWSARLRRSGAEGAEALAGAMDMWLWTLDFLQNGADRDGKKLYHGKRQGVTFPLADALGWLLAARSLMQDVAVLAAEAPAARAGRGRPGPRLLRRPGLRAGCPRAGEAARICASWCTATAGRAPGALVFEEFARLRQGVDTALSARGWPRTAPPRPDRVMIPEALDYPTVILRGRPTGAAPRPSPPSSHDFQPNTQAELPKCPVRAWRRTSCAWASARRWPDS